jgi:hypothetical protein
VLIHYNLKNYLFEKKSKKISKNAEFHADFESVEKVVKKCPDKKVISKTSLTNMSQSEKRAYFQNFFNGFEISVKFFVF